MDAWVTVLAALIAGFLGWSAKAWEVRRAREERYAERSEAAALEILRLVDEVRLKFDPYWGTYDGPDQDDIQEPFLLITQRSLDIRDDESRQKLIEAAQALFYYHEASPYGPEDGWLPIQVARKAAAATHEIVGAIRRGDRAVPATPELDAITARIAAFEADLDAQLSEDDPAD